MSKDVLVTGGAGFVGSHLVRALVKGGHSVNVLDNLSSGRRSNLDSVSDTGRLKLLVGDCRSPEDLDKALRGVHTVFHLAATPDVRLEIADSTMCYEHNILATYLLLEKIRRSNVDTIVLTSSSTVYGEPRVIPTPEEYGPLKPISVYGASKLACEAMISAYAHSFKKRGIIMRPANIVGPYATHGVILDFIRKLRTNPSELEILGDGTQTKSYLYVDDFVEALERAYRAGEGPVAIYNVGTEDRVNVTEIANIVIDEMNLKNVRLRYSGGLDGGRGWIGDIKSMLLDSRKIRSLGWRPKRNSNEAIREAVRHLKVEL